MPEPDACEAIQYSDQMRCDRCNLIWDMNDCDKPDCLTDEQLSAETARGAMREIRAELSVTQELTNARRALHDAIEYITHKGLYAEYLAMTGKEAP